MSPFGRLLAPHPGIPVGLGCRTRLYVTLGMIASMGFIPGCLDPLIEDPGVDEGASEWSEPNTAGQISPIDTGNPGAMGGENAVAPAVSPVPAPEVTPVGDSVDTTTANELPVVSAPPGPEPESPALESDAGAVRLDGGQGAQSMGDAQRGDGGATVGDAEIRLAGEELEPSEADAGTPVGDAGISALGR